MIMGIKMLKNSCVTGENDSQLHNNVAMLRLLQGNYHAFKIPKTEYDSSVHC